MELSVAGEPRAALEPPAAEPAPATILLAASVNAADDMTASAAALDEGAAELTGAAGALEGTLRRKAAAYDILIAAHKNSKSTVAEESAKFGGKKLARQNKIQFIMV